MPGCLPALSLAVSIERGFFIDLGKSSVFAPAYNYLFFTLLLIERFHAVIGRNCVCISTVADERNVEK